MLDDFRSNEMSINFSIQHKGEATIAFVLNKASAVIRFSAVACSLLTSKFERDRGAGMTLLQSRPKRRALLPSVARTLPCWQPEAHQLMQSLCVKRTRRSRRESVQGWQWASGTMVARAPARVRLFSLVRLPVRCTSMREKGRKEVRSPGKNAT